MIEASGDVVTDSMIQFLTIPLLFSNTDTFASAPSLVASLFQTVQLIICAPATENVTAPCTASLLPAALGIPDVPVAWFP